MQLISAVIKPFKVDEVRGLLSAINVQGMTTSAVSGFGRQGGHTETYRGTEYKVDFIPKMGSRSWSKTRRRGGGRGHHGGPHRQDR